MSKIKLCCLVDPMTQDNGLIKLFGQGEVTICKQCYNDLLNEIPQGIRDTDTKGVWEAMVDFIEFKLKAEHTHDS